MDLLIRLTHQAVDRIRPESTWTALCTIVAILLVSRVAYNVFLHPLSSYNGPAILAASDIPLAILQLRGTSQYTLKKAHDRYGSIVRIAPNTLSYIEPSAWNDIYGYKKGVAALPKDPNFYSEMLLEKETITIASDEDAKPIRRALNPAFSAKSLLQQEGMLQSHVNGLIIRLQEETKRSGVVDIRKWINLFFFDVLSDFAFGEDLGCVKNGAYHEWAQFVVDYFLAATLLHQCHKFWPLNRLLALLIPPSVRDRKRKHSEASLQRVRRRIQTPTERPDFMFHFLRQAEKEGLSNPVIEAQASVVILAGSETSGVGLTAALYHILGNHNVKEKLCQEVRSHFNSSADISLQKVLSNLPYLEACVKETLRIHAPLANGFTRVVAEKEGAVVCERWIPQSTIVTINHYCSNLSEQNFLNPYIFLPERWLNDPVFENDRRDVVQPFSVGPRDCPGKPFALNNLRYTLARLIWEFYMMLDKGAKD